MDAYNLLMSAAHWEYGILALARKCCPELSTKMIEFALTRYERHLKVITDAGYHAKPGAWRPSGAPTPDFNAIYKKVGNPDTLGLHCSFEIWCTAVGRTNSPCFCPDL